MKRAFAFQQLWKAILGLVLISTFGTGAAKADETELGSVSDLQVSFDVTAPAEAPLTLPEPTSIASRAGEPTPFAIDPLRYETTTSDSGEIAVIVPEMAENLQVCCNSTVDSEPQDREPRLKSLKFRPTLKIRF